MCDQHSFRKTAAPECLGMYNPMSEQCGKCGWQLECDDQPVPSAGIQQEAMR
jgi:hypothetical protein